MNLFKYFASQYFLLLGSVVLGGLVCAADLPLVDGLPPAATDIARLKPLQPNQSASFDTMYIRKPFTFIVYPSESPFTIKVFYKSVKEGTPIRPKLIVQKADKTMLQTFDFDVNSTTSAMSKSLTIDSLECNQPYRLEMDPDGAGGANGVVRITGTIKGGCGLLADDYINLNAGARHFSFYVPPSNQDFGIFVTPKQIYSSANSYKIAIYDNNGKVCTNIEDKITTDKVFRFPCQAGIWRISFNSVAHDVAFRVLAPASPVLVSHSSVNKDGVGIMYAKNLTLAVGSESASGDYIWRGGAAGGWYNPACWSGVTDGTIPHLTGDAVTFPSGAGAVDLLQGAYTLAGFTNDSADLKLSNGTLSLVGNGAYTVNAPTTFQRMTLSGGGFSFGANGCLRVAVGSQSVDTASLQLNFPLTLDATRFRVLGDNLSSGTYRVLSASELTGSDEFLTACPVTLSDDTYRATLSIKNNTLFLHVTKLPPSESGYTALDSVSAAYGQYFTTSLPAAPGTAAAIDMEWLSVEDAACLLGAKKGSARLELVGLKDGHWGYACSTTGEWIDTGKPAQIGSRYQVRVAYRYDKTYRLFVDGELLSTESAPLGTCDYLGLNYNLFARNNEGVGDQKAAAKIYSAQFYREKPQAVDKTLMTKWQAISNFTFTCLGTTVTFPTRRIDWSNTVWSASQADKGYYTFSRLQFMDDLMAYYKASHDDAAVTVFGEIMTSFYEDCPKPDDLVNYKANSSDYPCWRTIQAGWRGPVLADAYLTFSTSPAWTSLIDETFRKVVDDHIARLKVRHSENNWRTIELRGLVDLLLVVPGIDPEGVLLASAEQMLEQDIETQLYDDGFQFELSPFYHSTIPDNYKEIEARYAQMGLPTPSFMTSSGMLLFYEFYTKMVRPDFSLPPLNDSYVVDASAKLKAATKYFPEREDFRYVATKRAEGTSPEFLSYVFPNSGAVIFRSDWSPDAVWGYVDMSPPGESGHHNDDKLNFLMYAYGQEMLVEAGRCEATNSPMRYYTMGTRSHNSVLIDGYGQNYRHRYEWNDDERHEKAELTADVALENTIDWSQAMYNKGYGRDNSIYAQLKTVSHTRKVEFIKGDAPYFRITDTLNATDDEAHTYDILWHLSKSVSDDAISLTADGQSFTANFGGGVTLTATVTSYTGAEGHFEDLKGCIAGSPTNDKGERYEDLYKNAAYGDWKDGSDANNLQGWLPNDSGAGAAAIHTPVYKGSFTGSATIVTELRPSRP